MHFEGYDDLEPRSGLSNPFCQQMSASAFNPGKPPWPKVLCRQFHVRRIRQAGSVSRDEPESID
jgi:hypothetical protein